MSENGVPDELTSAPENLPPERLRRSTINRKLAGVAGGIGERFDVDANVVRVVFVVLTLLAGLGAAVYLALWALVPLGEDSDEKRVARTSGDNEPRWSFRSLILLAGALCLGLIFLSVIFRGPGSGRGISAFWLLFLVVLAVVSLLRPGHFWFLRFRHVPAWGAERDASSPCCSVSSGARTAGRRMEPGGARDAEFISAARSARGLSSRTNDFRVSARLRSRTTSFRTHT